MGAYSYSYAYSYTYFYPYPYSYSYIYMLLYFFPDIEPVGDGGSNRAQPPYRRGDAVGGGRIGPRLTCQG